MKRITAKDVLAGVMILLLSLMFATTSAAIYLSEPTAYKLSAATAQRGKPPPKVKAPTVSIAYPDDGATLKVGTHAIDVKATGEGITVKVTIGGVTTDITGTKSGDYYVYYPWEGTEGAHFITAEVTDKYGNKASDAIRVTVVSDIFTVTVSYELFIEIDYMDGHEPTSEVLDHIKVYYYVRGIVVTFYVDDMVPYDSSVSDAEFWAIEAKYNDGNDKAQDGVDADGDGRDYEYTLKEKWVLFGTAVEGQSSVVGYCYIKIENKDLVAGNYIFIADKTADNWSVNNKLEPYGAEATVLMHELGHSIGIAKVRVRGIFVSEIYDEDPFSVMSYLSTANAGLYWAWHYSNAYWTTKNMDYYKK